MSSPTPDGLKAEIDAGRMKVGNEVLDTTGLKISALQLLYADANSKLAAGTIPFMVPISQSTITEAVLHLTGTGAADVMTQTLVGGADATTFTKSGYIRVKITDSGSRIVTGYHYIQVGLLT